MNKAAIISLVAGALIGGTHAAALADAASDYPNRPITIVVNFPAGGTIDTQARVIGQKLQEKWGQPVIVENRTGAGGNIGTAAASSGDSNGYTLLATPPGPMSINQYLYKSLGYDPLKFVPITVMTQIPNMVTVRADLPVNSLKELIEYAKANPGKVTFASQGNGSTSHLSGQLLSNLAGLKMVHVPYKGEGPALLDLVAGRVDMFVGNVSAVVKYAEAKKVKMLAVASPKRSFVAPDIPTAAEAGLPGFEAIAWYALVAAPGTPPEVAQKLNAAAVEAMKMPDVKEKFRAFGGEVVGNSPKETTDFIASERVRWKSVIDSAGVTLD
ncbi:MAG: Bug family tripartite tricarboxylate transporter substrate binding protein [Noviherbaspirillum sp.]